MHVTEISLGILHVVESSDRRECELIGGKHTNYFLYMLLERFLAFFFQIMYRSHQIVRCSINWDIRVRKNG